MVYVVVDATPVFSVPLVSLLPTASSVSSTVLSFVPAPAVTWLRVSRLRP